MVPPLSASGAMPSSGGSRRLWAARVLTVPGAAALSVQEPLQFQWQQWEVQEQMQTWTIPRRAQLWDTILVLSSSSGSGCVNPPSVFCSSALTFESSPLF